MRKILLLLLVVLLSGCATFSPVPEGYRGPTSRISDTYDNYSVNSASAHYYELVAVSGNYVASSFGKTRSR
jgi:uncharacterized protein YceK